MRQINYALKNAEGSFKIRKTQGRIYVDADGEYDYDEVIDRLTKVFGIAYICPVVLLEDEGVEKLGEDVVNYVNQIYGENQPHRANQTHPADTAQTPDAPSFTFKVEARRARKNFPMNSMEINAFLGEKILEAIPNTKVDVHNPEEIIYVEVREKICLYSKSIEGPGGMPVGTSGKMMLLLSGGIDSPVAGHMIAKRGCKIDAVYFHAPPYTSERAKQKVVDLASIVSRYAGPIYLHVVNFTDIQMMIYKTCPHDELTIIMRRYMMKIAEYFANEGGSLGLVTGESIGQVASQTPQSLICTNDVCELPVYRPLIGFDKNEIIERSRAIDAFETSILPYEDCCTIFVAKHPVTKPRLKSIVKSEKLLEGKIEELYETALNTTQILKVTSEGSEDVTEREKSFRNKETTPIQEGNEKGDSPS